MTPLGYLMIILGVTLLIIFILYLVVSKKTKEHILDILKVFGSVISLISLFLVTYNNYVNGRNNDINRLTDFNTKFSDNIKNIIDILDNEKLIILKREIFYNTQEKPLKKTNINEYEFLNIAKIMIIMDNLYLRLMQEQELFNRQYDYRTYHVLLSKIFNSNKIKTYWKEQKRLHHREFIEHVNEEYNI